MLLKVPRRRVRTALFAERRWSAGSAELVRRCPSLHDGPTSAGTSVNTSVEKPPRGEDTATSADEGRKTQPRRRGPVPLHALEKSISAAVGAPSLGSFGALLNTCARDARWQHALWLLDDAMPGAGVNPDAYAFGAALSACARGSATARTVVLLERAEDRGCELNAVLFNTVIHTCAQVGLWESALHFLADMQARGVEPTIVSCTSALTACKRGGQWRSAVEVLEQTASAGLPLDKVAFGAAISACEKGKQWQMALNLLFRMPGARVVQDSSSYLAASAACAAGGRWEQTLSLLAHARRGGADPGRITFNSAVSACERGQAWASAVLVVEAMQGAGHAPGVEALRGALAACAGAGAGGAVPLQARLARQTLRGTLLTDASAPVRGECVAAASELRAGTPGGGAATDPMARAWWRLQRMLLDGLHQSGRGSTLASAGNLHDSHGPFLQGLFEVGCLTARDAANALGLTEADAQDWTAATEELRGRLRGSLWISREAPAAAHLATWCEYALRGDGWQDVLSSDSLAPDQAAAGGLANQLASSIS